MQIPKQFISQIEARADIRLSSFLKLNKNRYSLKPDSFSEAIDIALGEALTDDSPEIRPIRAAIVKQRREKRRRWTNLAHTKYESCDVSDVKNPFYPLYIQHSHSTAEQFLSIYGVDSLDAAILNEFEKIEKWRKEKDSYLIDYPLITNETHASIGKCFINDVLSMCLDIIIDDYDGNINQFLKQRPEFIMDAPIFSPKSVKLDINSTEGEMFASVITGPGTMTVYADGQKQTGIDYISMMDYRDEILISGLLSFITKDFYDSKTLYVEVGALAKMLFARNPSSKGYDEVVERLHKMSITRFYYEEPGNNSLSFGILDTVQTVDVNGKRMVKVVFGEQLFNSALTRSTISVTRDSFNQLTLSLSRLLYPNLQRERINLTLQNKIVSETDKRLHNRYEQIFFARIILLNPKQKTKNMTMIRQCLDEFVDKKIAIDSYNVINKTTIEIFYLPLTPDEQADLNIASRSALEQTIIDKNKLE